MDWTGMVEWTETRITKACALCNMQRLFKELSHPCIRERLCKPCDHQINVESNCFEHVCQYHSNIVDNLWCAEIISSLVTQKSHWTAY